MRRTTWCKLLVSAALMVTMWPGRVAAQPERVLRVGLYQNEPKIFRDVDGEPAGLFVDLMEEIADRERWSLKYVDCEWQRCLEMLESEELDLMPDVALTPGRARRFDFHDVPVLDSYSRVYAREFVQIRSEEDLAGKRIAVLRGSIQHEVLEQRAKAFDEPIELVASASYEEAFREAADGTAHGAVVNHFFGLRMAGAHGLVPTPVILLPAQLYFAAPRGRLAPELRAIDDYIDRWRGEAGSPYYTAMNTWTRASHPSQMARWLKVALAVSGLLLVFGFLAIHLLRREVKKRTQLLEVQNLALRERQDELAESQARSHRILEELPIPTGVWRVHDDGLQLELLNHAAEHLLDAQRSEWEGRRLEQYYAPDHPLRSAIERCLRTKQSERAEIELPLRQGGPLRQCVLTTGFLPPESVLVHLEDMTERLVMERRLQVKQRMETAGMLAGGVAHDFNNLLTVINVTAEMALEQATDPRLREELAQILLAGEQAADVTARLLAFSRDEIVKPTVMRLSDGVRQALSLLERLIEASIVVDVELTEGDDWVKIDAVQLQQIVMNLVVNARDALGVRGTIRVSTLVDADAQTAVLRVADDGEGMDEATRSRVFEPFFTTKEGDRGTGFGMSIVFGAVAQADGTIDIESEVGEGTTVTVTFPLTSEAASTQPPPPVPVTGRGVGRILVVEDDRAVRGIVQWVLEAEGYEVLTADSVGQALERINDGPIPDLLLTDVVMPGGSGIELAEEVRQSYPSIQIVLMSGYTDAQLAEHGAVGTYTVLSKPFSPQQLGQQVRNALSGAEKGQQTG